MDRFALEDSLRGASARVVAGQRALLSQRDQIRELEQCGLDASPARALLRVYEQSQAMALFDRNRLAHALETAVVIDETDHDAFADIDTYHRQAA